MIIDSHTHIYPDKIAEIIAKQSAASMHSELEGPMNLSGLLAHMQRCGIDASATFCVAEKPSVVKSANDFLMKVCDNRRIIGLGTLHPDFEDYKAEIRRLRAGGIKGIKFHSLFQGLYPDEERMMRFYPEMGDDMIAYFHMGQDPGRPSDTVKATPERLARVLEAFPKLKVVAAHFGALGMLEEATKHLLGKNLYFDTCWTISKPDPKLVADFVKKQGANRFLFGTDYPFGNGQTDRKWIMSLPLSDKDKGRILGDNAKELFRI